MCRRRSDADGIRGSVPPSRQQAALLRLFHVLVEVATTSGAPAPLDDRRPAEPGDGEAAPA